MKSTARNILLVLAFTVVIGFILSFYSKGIGFPENLQGWVTYIGVLILGVCGIAVVIYLKPHDVELIPWLLIAFVILAIAASSFMVTMNSRNSVLIKEHAIIIGAIPILFLLIILIAGGSEIAVSRVTSSLALSLFLLVAWIAFMHYQGIQSVNGLRYIFYTVALIGVAASIVFIFRESHVRIVLWAIMAFTTLVSVYAIFHSYGIGIFPWDSGLMRSGRSASSMGNANLLGSIAMASIPVGIGLLMSTSIRMRSRINPRWFYTAAFTFGTICTWGIVASKTRGSFIGLIALVILAPFSRFIRKGGWKTLATVAVIALFVAASVAALSDRFADLGRDGLGIFGDTEEVNQVAADAQETGTLGVRKLIWTGTFNMFVDKPLTGWGPGSFQIIFPAYRNPSYHLMGVSHNTLHAHSEYLEILSDIGIIGFALIIAVAISLILIFRRKREFTGLAEEPYAYSWLKFGLYAGIIALLAEASVSVALRWPPSLLYLALFIALSLALIPSNRRRINALFALPFVLIMLLLIIFGVKYYRDCELAGKYLFSGKDGNLAYVEQFRGEAFEYANRWSATGVPDYANIAANKFSDAVKVADLAVEGCTKCVETYDGELGGWYALGSSYLNRSLLYGGVTPALAQILDMDTTSYYNPQLAEEYVLLGIAAYDSLLLRAPNYAETHNNLSMAWLRIGQPEKALSSMVTAYNLYAHNRTNYILQLAIIAPAVDNLDAVRLIWISTPELPGGYVLSDDLEKGTNVIASKLVYSGLCFNIFSEVADSLAGSLSLLATEYYQPLAAGINEGIEIQMDELQKSLDVSRRWEQGNTEGLLEEFDAVKDILDILPIQNAVYGALLTESGDSEGREILIGLSNELIYTCFDNVLHWPLNGHLLDYAFADIQRTGLLNETDRTDLLNLEVQALILDRKLFKTVEMLLSSPLYAEHIDLAVFEELNSLWKWIGGPLYCLRHPEEASLYKDSTNVPNVTLYGSFLHGLNEYIDDRTELYPENPEFRMLKLKYLYILLLSFYMDTPQVSQEQSEEMLSGLQKARTDIELIYGSTDALYQTNRILSDATEIASEFRNAEYESLIHALASDIRTGNIRQ